jgi:replicative DNA helicase
MIYKPLDYIDNIHLHLERLADENISGISIGIETIDKYLDPLQKADLAIMLARPSMGKSVIAAHYARRGAIVYKNDQSSYAPPIFVSAEMPIEEIAIRCLSTYTGLDSRIIRTGKSNNDWKFLHTKADSMIEDYPIIYVGASIYTKNEQKRRLSINFVQECIDKICNEYGNSPSIVMIDYLQRLSMDGGSQDRRALISEIVEQTKDMALLYQIPILLCSQAGRSVDEKPFPVPDLQSGKETGNIEESADVVLGGFRPSRVFKIGQVIPKTEHNIICEEDLYFMSILKQRNGICGGAWIKMDARISELSDYETDYEITNE